MTGHHQLFDVLLSSLSLLKRQIIAEHARQDLSLGYRLQFLTLLSVAQTKREIIHIN